MKQIRLQKSQLIRYFLNTSKIVKLENQIKILLINMNVCQEYKITFKKSFTSQNLTFLANLFNELWNHLSNLPFIDPQSRLEMAKYNIFSKHGLAEGLRHKISRFKKANSQGWWRFRAILMSAKNQEGDSSTNLVHMSFFRLHFWKLIVSEEPELSNQVIFGFFRMWNHTSIKNFLYYCMYKISNWGQWTFQIKLN